MFTSRIWNLNPAFAVENKLIIVVLVQDCLLRFAFSFNQLERAASNGVSPVCSGAASIPQWPTRVIRRMKGASIMQGRINYVGRPLGNQFPVDILGSILVSMPSTDTLGGVFAMFDFRQRD